MRIVLFSPVGNQSAIGRVSALVIGALREQGHDVAVVSIDETVQAEADQLPDLGFVPHWTDDDAVRDAVRDADAIVHQIGNSYRFHAGSIVWLDRVGGIVCLHDHFLGHLFLEWTVRGHESEGSAVIEEWYGRSLNWFFDTARQGDIIAECWPAITFVEWLVSKSTAVITHSDNRLGPILDGSGGPVAIVPMPYDFSTTHERVASPDLNRTTILTFGVINPNKQADAVIRAIASNGTASQSTRYRLVGAIESTMRRHLSDLASSLSVDLTILGQVSDDDLAREIDAADVIACLRHPSLEAASASAIEAMLARKLVIVTNTGFYASLPDDAVLKVNPDNLVLELADRLSQVRRTPRMTKEYGARAEAYARATFVADNYATEIVAMVQRTEDGRAVREALAPIVATYGEWGMDPRSTLLAETTLVTDFFSAPR